MASKRYKKLPKKTNELAPNLVEKLIPEIKKNRRKKKHTYSPIHILLLLPT